MSFYEPLSRFLEGSAEGEVALSFEEVEAILDRDLPPSARKHQAWWANTPSHSHADSWLRLNWKTAKVDLAGERVVFAKNGRARPRSKAVGRVDSGTMRTSVIVDIHSLSWAARRLIGDYAEELGDMSSAVARALHEAAIARRRRLIDAFPLTGVKSDIDSVDLIREARRGR